MLKSAPARWLKDPEEPSFLDCLDRFGRHVPKLVDSFNAGLNLGGQGSRSGDTRIFLKRLGEYTALNQYRHSLPIWARTIPRILTKTKSRTMGDTNLNSLPKRKNF